MDWAADQVSRVINALAANRQDRATSRRYFPRALSTTPLPVQVSTDRAAVSP